MTLAYNKIRILDLTHVIAGPFCSYQFAVLGADVIKVESPYSPDCTRGRGPDADLNAKGLGLTYQAQGSNKRALSVDLTMPQGKEIINKLIPRSDVFLENFSPGTLDKFNLDYESVSTINPTIIYCSMSAYGPDPPRGDQGAYDNVIQAASGIIAQSSGHKPGVSFVDYAAGYNAAFAIASALYRRTTTGKGAHITCTMLETAMMMMAPEATAERHYVTRPAVKEAGLCTYETQTEPLMLGAFTPVHYKKLGHVLNVNGYRLTQIDQIENWEDVWSLSNNIREQLTLIFKKNSARYWISLLHQSDIPCERVRSLSLAVKDPQLKSRDFFQTVPGLADDEAIELPVAAYHISDGNPKLINQAPQAGEHNDQILKEIGYTESEIVHLRKLKVIG